MYASLSLNKKKRNWKETEKYRQRLPDALLRGAVGDELVQSDLAVVVQVHRLEDSSNVSLRVSSNHDVRSKMFHIFTIYPNPNK